MSPIIEILCTRCIFFCISISGVAVYSEKNFGVARCRRLGIADLRPLVELTEAVARASLAQYYYSAVKVCIESRRLLVRKADAIISISLRYLYS